MRSYSLTRDFFEELQRRRVPRTAAIYAIVAVSALEATDFYADMIGLPEVVIAFLALLAVFGFPVALILSWIFRICPEVPRGNDPDCDEFVREFVHPPDRRRWGVAVVSVVVAVVAAAMLSGHVHP